ncbi:ribonuclease H-like domain-containing protein [Tanacetum coccineum]|uniref:Ribonuclease H-like domain-containing protein n=1 Tax=Tanacetum coccineum TaxID=301880 RepID=A0ABQ5FXH2_9ASTR
MPNDDEIVDPNLNSDNKSQSDSSHSFVSGGDVNTTDFLDNSGNDTDSSEDIFATHNEKVTTLEDNIFSEGNLDQNPSTSTQDTQTVRRSSRQEMDALLRNSVLKGAPWRRKGVAKALKKFLYGLKQAPRHWNAKLTSTLIENGFSQSKSDYSLYTKSDKGVFLALLVYVDDIIITGNNISEIEKFKVYLKSKFMIKDLGKLKYFLGIEVIDTSKGICLNQRKYVFDLLYEYGMLACKPAKTPLMSKLIISNEAIENGLILDNITDYQKLMGKLIYLTNTRPDISYVVHCLSQFMDSPLKSHLKTTFKILRYLKSCTGLGIHIIKDSGMNLKAFSNADWAKCIVTKK